MAIAAQRAGYQVHVATRVTSGRAAIEDFGFHLHGINWPRGSYNPFHRVATWYQVRALYKRISPDLVHHVALEPTIIGSLAALGLPIMRLNALAGLGFVFTSPSKKARFASGIIARLLGWILRRPLTAALVQNDDDRVLLASIGVSKDKIFLVPGSGVDTRLLTPLPEPEGPFTTGFVGRLLDDKGVRTLIAAQRALAHSGPQVRFLLAGEPDAANPTSISVEEISTWRRIPEISLLGHVSDIRQVWASAHIAVLPSRREGFPKALLEAAACGRALVATDVPGCREIARDGLNALLVPPDDPVALAKAIKTLAEDATLRRKFATASRNLAEEFSADRIGREIVAIYNRMLAAAPLR